MRSGRTVSRDDALDVAEVGRGQRGQRHLVVAGAGQPLVDHGPDLGRRTFAHRPGDHPGLAEATAARAAAEDLDVEPVVHHLGERHQLVAGIGPVGQVGHGALLDLGGHVGIARGHRGQVLALVGHLVHRGHVHARHRRQPAQDLLTGALGAPGRLPVGHHLVDLPHHLLAVAQHDQVQEVGQRLGVVGAVAAGHDQGVLGPALGRPDRHAGQIDAVQQVGVDELGRQVEGQQIEGLGRLVGVDREQGQMVGAQQRLEVDPRGVGPFGQGIGPLVEDLVEDLQPLVGQADLVGVRIDEQPGHPTALVVRPLSPIFATDVPSGFLDPGQQRFKLRPDRIHPTEVTGSTGHPPKRHPGRASSNQRAKKAQAARPEPLNR